MSYMTNTQQSQKLRRWQQEMSQYDFDIQHIQGAENYLADALSRMYKNPDHILSQKDFISSSIDPTTTTHTITTLATAITPSSPDLIVNTFLSPTTRTPIIMPVYQHNQCAYNKCNGRDISAGHHQDCPFIEDDEPVIQQILHFMTNLFDNQSFNENVHLTNDCHLYHPPQPRPFDWSTSGPITTPAMAAPPSAVLLNYTSTSWCTTPPTPAPA